MAVSAFLFGCPNQELAPLSPCTVSGVSLEVPQSGVDKVDMLFMIDNSGSMTEEQRKLGLVLPGLVKILTTGNKNGMPSPEGMKPDFPPVQSLHIGVVTSDMGVNGAPAQNSCGNRSYFPDSKNPTADPMRLDKPLGDDGILQVDPAVAVAGIWGPTPTSATPVEQVPGDPTCGNVTFPPDRRFIDFTAGMTDPNEAARRFACIAKRGRNGCGLEQQLESALKALTPTDSKVTFAAGSHGHADPIAPNGARSYNQNFLRPDAILAIIMVTDEEDCSSPESSRAIFDANSDAFAGQINVRCGLKENQTALYSTMERYVAGFKALKATAYQDRLIFAAITGLPLAPNTGGVKVHSGADAINKLLDRPDMQFAVRPSASNPMIDEPVPTCTSASGDGTAAPGRRVLEVTKAFGNNGVATSICEDEYGTALQVIIDKIAAQLTGACLPRKLGTNPATGLVECDVVEIQAPNSALGCDANKGRIEQLPVRVVDGTPRTVCRMRQVTADSTEEGWYYDDKSNEVIQQCKDDPQRIAFTGNGNPSTGAQAKFECFQPVSSGVEEEDRGRDAINENCKRSQLPGRENDPFGDDKCGRRNGTGEPLICVSGTCQLLCERDSQCPDGWLCVPDPGDTSRSYCVNPTCPPAGT